MSRRQFFQDVRREGRGSVDSNAATPRATSTSSSANLNRGGDPSGSGTTEDLYTPLRHPEEGSHSPHDSGDAPTTDAYRDDDVGGNGSSPTPTKQYPAMHSAVNDPSRSRSSTVPYQRNSNTIVPGSGGAGKTPNVVYATSSGSRERSGSNAGTPSIFPIAQQQLPPRVTVDNSITRSPPTSISPRHMDAASTGSASVDRSLSRPSSGGTHPTGANAFFAATGGGGTTPPLPAAQAHSKGGSTTSPWYRSPGTTAADDDTPLQMGLDTPDHRGDRSGFAHRTRSPVGLSPATPPTEIRLHLDDPMSDPRALPGGHGYASTGFARERNGSVTRIEGTLVALQMELAGEKRSNIEAELTISSLRREVQTLREENRRLAAAAAAATGNAGCGAATEALSGSNTAGDLEQRVARLTMALESKQRELDEKDERVRLLEHKLADQLLLGSPVPMYYTQAPPQVQAQEPPPPQKPAHVSGQPLRGEVRPITPSDIPSAVGRRPGSEAPSTVTHTSDLQPVAAPGSQTVMESKLRARSSSALRAASPGAAPPAEEPAPSRSPHLRSTTATARRPSVRRVSSASKPSDEAPARPRAGSAMKRASVSQPRAGSVANDSFLRRGSAQSLSSARAARKPSSSSVLNSSMRSLPRDGGSPKQDSSARRLSSASTATRTQGQQQQQQPRRPSVQRAGSATRRNSGQPGGGHAFGLPSSHTPPAKGPATTVTTAGFANSTMYQQPPALRSMMGNPSVRRHTSPARSATASLRSGTSTRSRPRITYDERGDLTSMQGTTTTVVFRSSSTSARPVSVPPAYSLTNHAHTRPAAGREASLVPRRDSTGEGGGADEAAVSNLEASSDTAPL